MVKYPKRINMIQNGVVWSVLIKKPKDMDYFNNNGYIIVND